jgi:phospholipid/cholesterol/gamma-HCH transport system substrate-binding protein
MIMRTEVREAQERVDASIENELMRAAPVRRARREVVVGLFVLVGAIVILSAFLTLTDASMFHRRYLLTSVVADARGLRNGDPVRMRGVHIGRVRRFDMVREGVAIRMEIDRRFRVPADSRAVVRSSGLLEGMMVDVLPGAAPGALGDQAFIPAQPGAALLEKADQLSNRADSILAQIQTIVSPENARNVGRSIDVLPRLLTTLAQTLEQERGDLRELGASLRRSAAELERATANGRLERTVGNADSALVQLTGAGRSLAHASAALDSLLSRTERGSGTLGRLTHDDALYDQLLRTSTSLGLLAEDVRRNPGRYVKLSIF